MLLKLIRQVLTIWRTWGMARTKKIKTHGGLDILNTGIAITSRDVIIESLKSVDHIVVLYNGQAVGMIKYLKLKKEFIVGKCILFARYCEKEIVNRKIIDGYFEVMVINSHCENDAVLIDKIRISAFNIKEKEKNNG